MALTPTIHGAVETRSQLVIECRIFDLNRRLVRRFPGEQCLFLPDGTYISRNSTSLVRKNSDGRTLWTVPGHTHHLLELTADRRLLVMGSSVHEVSGRLTRFDVLKIFSLEGKLLRTYDFFEHWGELKARRPTFPDALFEYVLDRDELPDVDLEATHVNSFYEIPRNTAAVRDPAFRAGNFIVNVNLTGIILILDPTLRHILWSANYSDVVKSTNIHDVQVTPNGHILMYNNKPEGDKDPYSTLEEYDPVQKKIVWRYEATPRHTFYSEMCGGVQLLNNGNLLFNELRAPGAAIEIDRDGKEVWRFDRPSTDPITGKPILFQDVKRADLRQFLAHNHGP